MCACSFSGMLLKTCHLLKLIGAMGLGFFVEHVVFFFLKWLNFITFGVQLLFSPLFCCVVT